MPRAKTKVQTIASGLENIGALRSGGQGSVYKTRRTSEITTAVKLLPIPIHSESKEDKAYTAFTTEAEKLRKLSLKRNPHVVPVINYGISDTGNLPFIEMEYVEGLDLSEVIQPPRLPVLPVREAVRLAQHLSDALAHCHAAKVIHGDVRSSNVRLNAHTDNYELVGFGTAALPEEQRAGLRHTGAAEFMAPEIQQGMLVYQSDVYSFGVVLFHMIAGRVPFPLKDPGEGERSEVLAAHLEAPVPDLLALRAAHLPDTWTEEQRARELQLPDWLVETVSRCLEKRTMQRFITGKELHDHVMVHSTAVAESAQPHVAVEKRVELLKDQYHKLMLQRDNLNKELAGSKVRLGEQEQQITALQSSLTHRELELQEMTLRINASRHRRVPMWAFMTTLGVALGAATLAGYQLYGSGGKVAAASPIVTQLSSQTTGEARLPAPAQKPAATQPAAAQAAAKDPAAPPPVRPEAKKAEKQEETVAEKTTAEEPARTAAAGAEPKEDVLEETPMPTDYEAYEDPSAGSGYYKVRSKAYFHNDADENTRRSAFIVHWNNAVLTPLEEKNGFIYIVFTNHEGVTSKGWLRKKDLRELKVSELKH